MKIDQLFVHIPPTIEDVAPAPAVETVVEETPPVIEERSTPVNVTLSADFLNVYGHDMSDPKHKNFSRELRFLKDSDPALYHKIVTMN